MCTSWGPWTVETAVTSAWNVQEATKLFLSLYFPMGVENSLSLHRLRPLAAYVSWDWRNNILRWREMNPCYRFLSAILYLWLTLCGKLFGCAIYIALLVNREGLCSTVAHGLLNSWEVNTLYEHLFTACNIYVGPVSLPLYGCLRDVTGSWSTVQSDVTIFDTQSALRRLCFFPLDSYSVS